MNAAEIGAIASAASAVLALIEKYGPEAWATVKGNRPLWAALIMRPVCAVYSRVSSSMATVRG
ncbi:hypothetical protein HNH97_13305, partial [Gluconacetobacter entanii]|nr:hypothetical protein [Gluconacetobacter entanii]